MRFFPQKSEKKEITMWYLLIGVGIVAYGLVTFGVLLLLLPILARQSILVTTIRESTAIGIMVGDSLRDIKISMKNYHIYKPTRKTFAPTKAVKPVEWQIYYHGEGNPYGFKTTDDSYDDRMWLLKYLGLYWVGWPWENRRVYIYMFGWNEPQIGNDGSEKIWARLEPTDFIMLADFTYVIRTTEAETNENLSVDLETYITVAIRNPKLALFNGEDWMRRVTAAVNRVAREYVGARKYEDLITHSTDFSKKIVDLTDNLTEIASGEVLKETLDDTVESEKKVSARDARGLLGRYGVKIRTADLQRITLTGNAAQANTAAATKVYLAKRDAKSIKIKSKADAYAIRQVGNATADAITAETNAVAAGGDDGRLVASLQALKQSGKDGNVIVQASSLADGLLGNLMKGQKK